MKSNYLRNQNSLNQQLINSKKDNPSPVSASLKPSMVLHIALTISLIQGVVLAYFSTKGEPLYKYLMLNEFMSYLGEIYNEEDAISDQKTQNKVTQYEMMSKQLSIDLIYTILYSITECSIGQNKVHDPH